MRFDKLIRPTSLTEAYEAYNSSSNSVLIGGGLFTRLNEKHYDVAIDLSTLGLDYIKETTTASGIASIEIGCMTTLHKLEDNEMLNKKFHGIFEKSLKNIIGIQFRNIASVGGTVSGRYGFSELNTVLLAMNAKVKLYKGGEMNFSDYLAQKNREKDILEKIILDTNVTAIAYQMMRKTAGDFPVMTCATAIVDGLVNISVGGRPLACKYATKAMEILNTGGMNKSLIDTAAASAQSELEFGNDVRASQDYRKQICPVLVRRALTEVLT